MKVGDRVILSDVGMKAYGDTDPCNPWFTLGTFERTLREPKNGFTLYVKWSNGYANSYRIKDLQVIQC